MYTIRTDDLFASISTNTVEARRVFISRYFFAAFGGVVRYGPLKGFKLDDNPSWGGLGDIAPKLFGLYEQEVLTRAAASRGKQKVVVNLGAGDGYYGVGLVAAGLFERSVCFELSEKGRDSIKAAAQKNGIAEKVTVLGTAGEDFAKVVTGQGVKLSDCLIICDIEGAEFSIFSKQCLTDLQTAHIIIELHGYLLSPSNALAPPGMPTNGDQLERDLISNSQQLFETSIVKTSVRDLSAIPEMDVLNDSDRWLICSEGRPKLMSWLVLNPK